MYNLKVKVDDLFTESNDKFASFQDANKKRVGQSIINPKTGKEGKYSVVFSDSMYITKHGKDYILVKVDNRNKTQQMPISAKEHKAMMDFIGLVKYK